MKKQARVGEVSVPCAKPLEVGIPMFFVLHALAMWRQSFTVDWNRSFQSRFAFEAMVPVTSLVRVAAHSITSHVMQI